MNIAQFQRDVLYWYDHHGRKDLPWQQDKNHYRVWLSEIMLQQTQVSTVIDYYLRFLERYPSVEDLANAPQDEVMALWSGLGYYARARNLHKTAQIVAFQLNGQFPQTLEGICALPGIGRSTGSAILALTDNQALPILDGNVKRVLSRLFCEGDIDALWAHAERLVPAKQATPYTQAMMDLGAMICTRHNPKCLICPIQKHCMAFKESRIAEFPLKQNRPQKDSKIEYFLLAYFQNQ
ncbi:MAG: A/G-specific adenine glycosylase, partial [Gammaproteobacteria bacterium]|nr:A/G-specific adenine glycosylase [Gammaproteobacteria bacterium]